jgi:fission process protein 1
MTKNPMATHSHHDFKSSNKDDGGDDNKYNIFRDSLLRYCGYANEVGESFRYQYPRLVGPSYVLAFGYCLADSVSAGYQVMASEKGSDADVNNKDVRSKEKRAAIAMFDTLLWVSRICICTA